MKKIINGLRYDTDKAVTIGEFDNIGAGATTTTDFQYWEATLYRTPRSGKYFLVGEGGPMSRFGTQSDENTRGWGVKILPMERQEAFEWAQRYLDADVVEKEFSDLIVDA